MLIYRDVGFLVICVRLCCDKQLTCWQITLFLSQSDLQRPISTSESYWKELDQSQRWRGDGLEELGIRFAKKAAATS